MGKIRVYFEGRDCADRLNEGVKEDYWMTEQTDSGCCHSLSQRDSEGGRAGWRDKGGEENRSCWKCFVCDAYWTCNKLEIRGQI